MHVSRYRAIPVIRHVAQGRAPEHYPPEGPARGLGGQELIIGQLEQGCTLLGSEMPDC